MAAAAAAAAVPAVSAAAVASARRGSAKPPRRRRARRPREVRRPGPGRRPDEREGQTATATVASGTPGPSLLSPKSSARARCARAYRTGEQARRWLLGIPGLRGPPWPIAAKRAAALGSLFLGPRGPGGRGQLLCLLFSQPASVMVN